MPAPYKRTSDTSSNMSYRHDYPDGSPNYGSRAFQAVISCVDFAYEAVEKALLTSTLATDEDEMIKHVARCILHVSDISQCRLSKRPRPDRFHITHARARGAMREAMQVSLPPIDKPFEHPRWIEWQQNVQEDTDLILDIADELYAEPVLLASDLDPELDTH